MTIRRLLALVAALALLAAACGDSTDTTSDDGDSTADEAETTTTAAPADDETDSSEVTDSGDDDSRDDADSSDDTDEAATDESPSAIISLSPTATEMLFAIGAGDQVLAVDDFSNFPDEAVAKQQGISGFEPNVEAIAALEPDLVVTDGTNADFLAQLDSLGIAHWEGPAATGFDDVYTQIEQLGAATGHVGEAAELVSELSARVEAVKADLPEVGELTYYHELDPTFYSVSPSTFIGAVYAEVGLVNIVDDSQGPFPQLSQEFILEADPDLIFLACTVYCGETAESVAARDGWDALSAVQNGTVIEMNDDVASRWGPRIVDYLEQVGAAVAAVPVG